MRLDSVKNKVALIFGATGGIGSEVARFLNASGARIALAARDSARLDALAKELPGSASFVTDMRFSEQVSSLHRRGNSSFFTENSAEYFKYCVDLS